MRVRSVKISSWRNLRDVQLQVPDDAAVVCLVGENGTGKSTVLELLSAAAHQLGISQGVEISRGNPLEEPHEIEVEVDVPLPGLELPDGVTEQLQLRGESWSGRLRFTSWLRPTGERSTMVSAEGIEEPNLRTQVAHYAVEALRSRQETQHLYLDADRAYPPMQMQPHQFSELWSEQWASPEWTRQWAHRPTRTLYEEWNKYFLALEERVSTEHVAAIRRARQTGGEPPEFEDPFDAYRAAVQAVLPHLQFVGVQSTGASRTILFDSAGLEIPFSRLSGGEREIAFLIGQIDRFRLRRGLLLIDEPELHLNPDLLRTWIAYLRDTVNDGQVWIATHSLEAVEVAGPEATFVFEKDRESRLVQGVQPLAGRPVITALSAAIGAPAFSVSRLRFVFVEGDRQTRERERFFGICGGAVTNRFIEGGSCHEVLRRLEHVRELAAETGEQLHVGGVLDRDFRSDQDAEALESRSGVHVLRCHEIENFFLQPEAIEVLARRADMAVDVHDLVREVSDGFAGLWIAQRADAAAADLGETPKGAMGVWSAATWPKVDEEFSSLLAASSSHFAEPDDAERWRAALSGAAEEYRQHRTADDWWTMCLGKQSAGRVAKRLGFSGVAIMERHVLQLWSEGSVPAPSAVTALRQYVDGLS